MPLSSFSILRIEAAGSSIISVNLYRATKHQIAENSNYEGTGTLIYETVAS
jgi:hypothetical protein